jgi:O-antigen ligase
MYGYDANDNGLILVVAAPLSILVFRTSGRLGRLLSGATLLGIVWTIALTGSRGAFLAMASVVLALLLLLEGVSISRRVGILAALVGTLALAAPKGYWEQMGTILSPTEDYNWSADAGRMALARRGLGYMMDHPFFGIGIRNFQRAEGTISSIARNAMPGQGVPWLAPHNSYIQAGAEMGIPGGLAFLVLVVGGVVGMLRLRRRLPSAWRLGDPEERFLYHAARYLAVAHLGFAVAALFLSFAYLDPIYVLSAFSAGTYATARRRLGGRRRALHPTRAPGMRGGLSLVGREA